MKNALFIFVVAFLALISFSCTSREVKEKLAVSEQLMMSQPDSALTLIESIDPKQLHSDRDKALYGLLYTMALDKDHQLVTNDTIIDFSVEYFRNNSDENHLAEALYYQGRAKYHNNKFPAALLSFLQAVEEAEKNKDPFYIGMACRGISDIYSDSMNGGDELAYAKREYDNLSEAGIQPYINYAKWDLARSYQSNGEYKKVYELTTQLVDSANLTQDTFLYVTSQRLRAKAALGEDNAEEARKIYESLCNDGFSNNEDSTFLSVSYALTGNHNKSSYILENTQIEDSMLYEYAHYHVNKAQGNIHEALKHYEILDKLSTDTLQSKIAIGFSAYVSDYYRLLNNQNHKNLKKTKSLSILSLIIAFLTVALVLICAYHIIQRQKLFIQDRVNYAKELKRMLSDSSDKNIQSRNSLKDIFSDKYVLIEDLCNIVSTQIDSKNAQKIIADKVNILIKEISIDGIKIQQLEDEVNKTHDNIISDFKNDLPGLKDADYCLFLFTVLKFKNPAIRLLLREEKVNAIYNRKRRLKDRINKLEHNKANRYIRYFNYSSEI